LSEGIGTSLYDLKHNYTTDQIFLFYEKCRKNRLEDYRMEALVLTQSMVYTSPSNDKGSVRKKQRMWDKFIKSLDYEHLIAKSQKKIQNPEKMLNVFKRIGVPVYKKEVK